MEPSIQLATCTVSIKHPDIIDSVFNISHIIAKRMNKDYINLVFIYDRDKGGHNLFITTENTKDEIEIRNEKSTYYMIPYDPKNIAIEYKCPSKNIAISVEAKMFHLFAKIRKHSKKKHERNYSN
jgi:hypothetical protein